MWSVIARLNTAYMLKINFGHTATDYAQHRAGFPASLFERLHTYGVGLPKQRILDMGTGVGTLARGFAKRGANVIALDPSTALMQAAQHLDQQTGTRVRYVRAYAEQTALASASFDVVTAGQCWHWFDRRAAAWEAKRLLVPGGTLVIAHFDWIVLPENIAALTEQLIQQYNPTWNPNAYNLSQQGIYPMWLQDVGTAHYKDIETFSFDEDVLYTHEAWRGRIRASAGVASMPADVVIQFDSALRDLLDINYAPDPMPIPHRVWALVCRR